MAQAIRMDHSAYNFLWKNNMKITNHDRSILRKLAEAVAEIARSFCLSVADAFGERAALPLHK